MGAGVSGYFQKGYGQQDTWVDGLCMPRVCAQSWGQGMALNMNRVVQEGKKGGKLSFLKKYFSHVEHCILNVIALLSTSIIGNFQAEKQKN